MAMDSSAADSYVYAKASGMLASSYVGRRAAKLFSVRTLHELWDLVCEKEVPAVPEAVLPNCWKLKHVITLLNPIKNSFQITQILLRYWFLWCIFLITTT